MRSSYSVDQSSSDAGTASGPKNGMLRPHTRHSTPRWRMRSAAIGRNRSATAASTSRVSAALQTPGRWVLASSKILRAIFKSAAASTYTWQMPSRCFSTGTLAYSITVRISPFPPLGMITFRQESSSHNCFTSSRLPESRSWRASAGTADSARASRSTAARTLLVRRDSLPPRRMTAFPDFRHREAASQVTVPRLS